MHLDRDLALPFNFHVDRSRFFKLVIVTTFSAQPPLLPFNGEHRRL